MTLEKSVERGCQDCSMLGYPPATYLEGAGPYKPSFGPKVEAVLTRW